MLCAGVVVGVLARRWAVLLLALIWIPITFIPPSETDMNLWGVLAVALLLVAIQAVGLAAGVAWGRWARGS